MSIEARLSQLGITLPAAPKPAGAYVPSVRSGALLFIAGQIPMKDGVLLHPGQVRGDSTVTIAEAQLAARQCIINALAVVRDAAGSLDAVKRCVRLGVFVSCGPEFKDHPKVANGASELVVEIFGDAGRHARAAVGSSSLPLGAAVEVETLWELAH